VVWCVGTDNPDEAGISIFTYMYTIEFRCVRYVFSIWKVVIYDSSENILQFFKFLTFFMIEPCI
jgi:hypothetical protein